MRRAHDANDLAFAMERWVEIGRWTTFALAALQIWGLGWGALIWNSRYAGGWELGRWPVAPEAVVLLAPMLAWLCFWSAQYAVEKGVRERALPVPAARRPARP